ncbi:MAG: MvaI/BcnI family restriction endonuclease [Kiritimatiellae bacterium]|jgi:hypothetical protein|nr:MvaI/BcnI family restriction endonuclease [Kiritimatiellia bacterium]
MRNLTETEKDRIKLLTNYSVAVALIEPTETGLKKSILDATGSVRSYLKENNLHDYDIQGQGSENKVILPGLIYEPLSIHHSNVSLYRPNTKNGDPRIWFSKLNKYACPNDIIALIAFHGTIHLLNLTSFPLKEMLCSQIANPTKELISEINRTENIVSNELLLKLRKIASRGWIQSMVPADTSVGRTLETALGIDINSSQQPDYKGIELKSFRANKSGNRKNLFAKVPDWKLSKFKSSAEILNEFGYWKDDDFKLYCTVSAINRNSQGLTLCVNADLEQLIENSDNHNVGDFAVWTLDKLHDKLQKKHNETFWVKADTMMESGVEYFQYKEVKHTKKPMNSQFDILLEQGIITLDHLIKRDPRGRVVEKGPLFKIKLAGLDLLFPPSQNYSLIDF